MSFFQISSSTIDTLLGYIGTLFQDVMPLFLIVISLAIGLFIVSSLVGLVRPKMRQANPDVEDFDDEDF
jgi:hypothetical protein